MEATAPKLNRSQTACCWSHNRCECDGLTNMEYIRPPTSEIPSEYPVTCFNRRSPEASRFRAGPLWHTGKNVMIKLWESLQPQRSILNMGTTTVWMVDGGTCMAPAPGYGQDHHHTRQPTHYQEPRSAFHFSLAAWALPDHAGRDVRPKGSTRGLGVRMRGSNDSWDCLVGHALRRLSSPNWDDVGSVC